MIINYVPEGTEINAPKRATPGAAGWDIEAAHDATLKPYQAARISSGLRCEIPPQHALLLLPRSGFSFTRQVILPNSVGLIDEDYRGTISLLVMWMPEPLSVIELVEVFGPPPWSPSYERLHPILRYKKDAVLEIKRGDRITQSLLIKYEEQEWSAVNALSASGRGANGLGSTGIRANDSVDLGGSHPAGGTV